MNEHILEPAPSDLNINVNCDYWEYSKLRETDDRRMYIYGEIEPITGDDCLYFDVSSTPFIVEQIINYNRIDEGVEPKDRSPIRIYINSPGGSVTEGLALISAIELSQTPIYTINIGQWSSMAFLIGIAGHKRLSLPNASFLMHDGYILLHGSVDKVKDRFEFETKMEKEVIKPFILGHSVMSEEEYDLLERKELYMLPKEALEYGFIDEIVSDISTIF